MNPIVSAADSKLLARVTRLRASAFAINTEIGGMFAKRAAQGWKKAGIQGLAEACDALHDLLREVPGSWSTYCAARDLAHDIRMAVS